MVETQKGRKIKDLPSENEKEYDNQSSNKILLKHGI